MRRQERFKDTLYFTYYNANPKNRLTGDCVVRALSLFLDKDYYTVYKELYDTSLKTGEMLNEKRNYERYLKDQGIVKQKQPRQSDNTKYTGKEFIREITEDNKRYFCKIGTHHVTAIKDRRIYDTWDCTSKAVGNYWVINERG